MRLSTSSSNPAAFSEKHIRAILLGLLIGIFLILIVENILRFKGASPNVRDTPELWASQRARASSLGKDALILVGSSRIQLDLDLDALDKHTDMKPVQLAIDGSPYLQVLENLAKDESVTGTVLISTTLPKFFPGDNSMRVNKWIAVYENEYRNLWSPAREQMMAAWLQSVSALYANIIPLDKLFSILINQTKFRKNYLETFPSRERSADYSLVRMPDFYMRRVERELGLPLPEGPFDSYDNYRDTVISLARENYKEFNVDEKRLRKIKSAIKKLKNRGASVIFTKLPMSGLIESIADIRYPEALWKRIVSELEVEFIDYKHHPELLYQLPDGSHLDKTQKTEFTERFARVLMQKNIL